MSLNKTYKLCLTTIFILVLSACASTNSRFSDYKELVKRQPSYALVVDLFVYQDIKGKSRGYNEQKNIDSLSEATTEITNIMVERGFSVDVLTELNGLTYEPDENTDYVISENWKSTGEPYNGLVLDQGDNPWRSTSTRDFLSNMVKVAKEINNAKDKDQAYAQRRVVEDSANSEQKTPVKKIDLQWDSSLSEGYEADIVLFVKLEGRFQKFGKYLAQGILVGAATNALTGGLTIIPPGSFVTATVIAFDTKLNKIMWRNAHRSEGKNAVKNSIKFALRPHPYSDGETTFEKKRRKNRKPR